MKQDLVLNIEPAAASDIRSLNDHIVNRVKDGTSAIDLDRTHLNQHLHGDPAGPSASLEALYAGGVKRPATQAEAPYLRIVISVSPEYFRPDDPDARGTWDEAKMEAWRDRALAWLREEFGDDLVYADLHLDEDTPHIHAVVAPTYSKKPRRPGKRKRSETEEQFEARKLAAENGATVRTVGRASHPTLSKPGSFKALRERLTACLSDLGIEYGNDRTPDAPDGMSTREWVAQQTVKLREREKKLNAREARLEHQEQAQDAHDEQLDEREQKLQTAENECKAWADELLERETQLEERERTLSRVLSVVTRLIGSVAERLGVRSTLREIEDAIVGAGIEVENPLQNPDEDAGACLSFDGS